jgi:DNA-binding SARP family transcriptional activator
MEFRILGPLEVVEQGRSIPLGGMRQRALLTVFLLRANTVVAADRLLEEVWGDDPPASGLRSVQVYVSQLRKLLGDGAIETRSPGYMLVADDGELDLRCFEALLAEARALDAVGAAAKLREALALWRGPPLAEFAYSAFAQAEIGRLEELRLTALEARIEADLELGAHAEIAGELEALVLENPLRERFRAQLMLALYRAERQSEALSAYQEGSRRLREDLGLEPGRALRDLEQAILRQDSALDLAPLEDVADEAPRSVFVGREAEIAELAAALEDTVAGRGRLFLLAGEPGIGKSRLADELLTRARARGARTLVGRCWEAGGAPAYWPWVQSLRAYVRETDPETLLRELGSDAADLSQILPELREILPGLPEPRPLEPDAARFRLFDAATQFLRRASAARPVVLFLDDLHAADEPSLLLLRFLARELASSRVLVVAAYRDVDPVPGAALTELLAELTRETAGRRMPLRGLTTGDVAAYVDSTAAEIASSEVVAALLAETEGNPLFIGEIVRLLATEGIRSEAIAEARLAVPQSVRDVIARRLAHLSDESNRLLALASVLGREFDISTLARLGGASEEDVLEALDEPMTVRVISEVPGAPGRLRFAHVLIRETLYDGLTMTRRVRLHRSATETLERLYGDEAGPHLAELAHHAIAGSDFDKGLAYARRAGDRALALLAYEEAERLYRTALDALELARPAAERDRCDLLLALGEAESAADRLAAKQTFLEAAAIARRLGLSLELGRAAAGYGGQYLHERAGVDEQLVPLLGEALETLGEEDVVLRVRLLARLAGALRDERSRERRDVLSAEAVQLARRTGDELALAYALDGRAHAITAPDTLDQCLALATELQDLAQRTGQTDQLLHGHQDRLMVNVVLGRMSDADADLQMIVGLAEQLGQPAHLWQAAAFRAELALARGELDRAQGLIEDAFVLGSRAQPAMATPIYVLQRQTLGEFRGTLVEIERDLAELAAAYRMRPAFRCVLAHVHARLGRIAEARQELEELTADDAAALPFEQEWLYAMSFLAETAAAVRAVDAAAVLYRLLLPWEHLNAADHPEGIRGSLARYLGLLAATLERPDQAERHLEAAIEANEQRGLLPWLAYSQRDYAHLLPGSKRARELSGRADALYAELGIAPF